MAPFFPEPSLLKKADTGYKPLKLLKLPPSQCVQIFRRCSHSPKMQRHAGLFWFRMFCGAELKLKENVSLKIEVNRFIVSEVQPVRNNSLSVI
jgi:hypothetical protein